MTLDAYSEVAAFAPQCPAGVSEASSKWVGKTKNYYNYSKKWVGTHPFSIMVRQKSGWARVHPAHPAPTPLGHQRRGKDVQEDPITNNGSSIFPMKIVGIRNSKRNTVVLSLELEKQD